MKSFRASLAAMALLLIGSGVASAAPIELTAPDGRTVILYDDFTWEYKRAAPNREADTVASDDLIARPSNYLNQDVVVTGFVTNLLGAYRLTSEKGQNNIVVEIDRVRREDQIKLEEALKEAGFMGRVRAQIQGQIKQGTVTYYIAASNIIVVGL